MTQPRGKGAPGLGQERARPAAGEPGDKPLLPAHRRAAEVLRRLRALQEKVLRPRARDGA